MAPSVDRRSFWVLWVAKWDQMALDRIETCWVLKPDWSLQHCVTFIRPFQVKDASSICGTSLILGGSTIVIPRVTIKLGHGIIWRPGKRLSVRPSTLNAEAKFVWLVWVLCTKIKLGTLSWPWLGWKKCASAWYGCSSMGTQCMYKK